jgi:hypothetical protein
MYKRLAVIAGTLAILSAALLTSNHAVAGGGSASAPSKYAHANKVASQQANINRQAGRTDYQITEYSSSSARNRCSRNTFC